jgi:predicted ArsR family transcriptional regulator
MKTTSSDHIRPIDQTVLESIRQRGDRTVRELTVELGVTATAIRQRLERLVEMQLVERKKVSVGRGRPLFRYGLTKTGARMASVSYAELAEALWDEILGLPDPDQRANVLHGVAKRLGDGLKESIPLTGDLNQRLAATVDALTRRRIPAAVNASSGLPVLEVQACPYPGLAEADDRRQLCEIEQEMISEALGQTVELDCCRLDGYSLCQFRPVAAAE